MVKSSEFHRQITKRGKKRGWKWVKGDGEGSHRIYEDKNGIRYPVPYHGAKEMGEGEDFCHEIAMAGLLHDIGKIKMCRFLYQKQGNSNSLQIENVKYIKKHSAYSYEILRKKNIVSLFTLEAIYHHHENYDGSGYPYGLAGEEIPLLSRVLAIVDAYDVMVNDQLYKGAVSEEHAMEELRKYAGSQFDPKLVNLFEEYLKESK